MFEQQQKKVKLLLSFDKYLLLILFSSNLSVLSFLSFFFQTEVEAASTLPEGMSLDDIYNPIRESIEKILRPILFSKKGISNQIIISTGKEIESDTISNKSLSNNDMVLGDDGRPINYYKFIGQTVDKDTVYEDGNKEEKEQGEKFLMSEIEKYRMRQLQRDKYVFLFLISL